MKPVLALALVALALFLPGLAVAELTIYPADSVACKHRARTVSQTLEVSEVSTVAPAEVAPAPPDPPPDAPAKAKKGGCGCSEGCDCTFCKCKDEDQDKCSEDCPCKRVLGTPVPRQAITNYGVIKDGHPPQRERYLISGEAVSPSQAYQALRGASAAAIPDDRRLMSLTLCGGTDQERAAALKAIAALGLDSLTLVQSYAADSPLLRVGFVAPSAYLQDASGKVLARSPQMTAALFAALRKQVAGYDPATDPNPLAPPPPPPSEWDAFLARAQADLAAVPGWAWVFALVGVVVVSGLKKQPA